MAEASFYCEECGKRGSVEYLEGEGVMAVIHLMEDKHLKSSPDCLNPTSCLKIFVPNKLDEEELRAIIALPEM